MEKLKNIFIKENYHYNGLQLVGMSLTLTGFVPTTTFTHGIIYIIIGLVMYWIGKRTKK